MGTHKDTTRPPLQVTCAHGTAPHGVVPVQVVNAAFVTAFFSASSPAATGRTTSLVGTNAEAVSVENVVLKSTGS